MADTMLRRTPQQSRGQRRIDAILDAAERLLAERGYEATTTNAIAAYAQTSIGSLYQFFPNKEAVLEALGARYVEGMCEFRDTLLGPQAASLGVAEWIDRAVDALVQTQANNLGFKALFCDPATPATLIAAEDDLHRSIREGVEAVFAVWAPDLPAERRAIYATLGISVVKAILPHTMPGAANPEAARAELKTLLRAYLEPIFGGDRQRA